MRVFKIVGAVLAASVALYAASPTGASATPRYFHFHFPHGGHFAHGGGRVVSWPTVYIIGGAASVILNAAIVWRTQCRELSSQEAVTSFFLPVVGIAFDAQASKCKR